MIADTIKDVDAFPIERNNEDAPSYTEIKGKENEKPQEQTDAVDTDGVEGNIKQEDVEAAAALVLEWGEKFF